nr:hypothetical protein [Conexibacter sp. W3-3-2]
MASTSSFTRDSLSTIARPSRSLNAQASSRSACCSARSAAACALRSASAAAGSTSSCAKSGVSPSAAARGGLLRELGAALVLLLALLERRGDHVADQLRHDVGAEDQPAVLAAERRVERLRRGEAAEAEVDPCGPGAGQLLQLVQLLDGLGVEVEPLEEHEAGRGVDAGRQLVGLGEDLGGPGERLVPRPRLRAILGLHDLADERGRGGGRGLREGAQPGDGAERNAPVSELLVQVHGEVQQLQVLADVGLGAAEPQRDRLDRPAALAQAAVGLRALERVEVHAQLVLDQRVLQPVLLVLRLRDDHRRDLRQARLLRGGEAAVAGEQLVAAVRVHGDADRLQHAALLNGEHEAGEVVVAHDVRPGVEAVGAVHVGDRHEGLLDGDGLAVLLGAHAHSLSGRWTARVAVRSPTTRTPPGACNSGPGSDRRPDGAPLSPLLPPCRLVVPPATFAPDSGVSPGRRGVRADGHAGTLARDERSVYAARTEALTWKCDGTAAWSASCTTEP